MKESRDGHCVYCWLRRVLYRLQAVCLAARCCAVSEARGSAWDVPWRTHSSYLLRLN
jgi:hypothetical protein